MCSNCLARFNELQEIDNSIQKTVKTAIAEQQRDLLISLSDEIQNCMSDFATCHRWKFTHHIQKSRADELILRSQRALNEIYFGSLNIALSGGFGRHASL